ncbi:MAG: ABC transporter ATP-binding protein [Rhodocyclaceae bacterium]|nr:ABC transporter ATP-binding protein [Rhodocyclaceae bacterium]
MEILPKHVSTEGKELLRISALLVEFPTAHRHHLTAVDGVDLDVRSGEALGLIGESGCGKSVTGKAAMGLIDPPARVGGAVFWQGLNVTGYSERQWRDIRGTGIAMLFQDSAASLNPALRVRDQLLGILKLHRRLPKNEAEREAQRILEAVWLPDHKRILGLYAHECSGGMAQRIALALALACRPKLLIADEPTSALDATIAVQIIELLQAVRDEFSLSILFISHDLGAVGRMCDRIAVMYLGRIVEIGPAAEVFTQPLHPYTSMLIAASSWRLEAPPGRTPDLSEIPNARGQIPASGCRFHSRCPRAQLRCRSESPVLEPYGNAAHKSACWYPQT